MPEYVPMQFYPQDIYGSPQSRMFNRGQYTSLVPYIQEQSQYLPQWYALQRQYQLEQEQQQIEQDYLKEMERQAESARRIEMLNLGITGVKTATDVGIPQYAYRKAIKPAYQAIRGIGQPGIATPIVQRMRETASQGIGMFAPRPTTYPALSQYVPTGSTVPTAGFARERLGMFAPKQQAIPSPSIPSPSINWLQTGAKYGGSALSGFQWGQTVGGRQRSDVQKGITGFLAGAGGTGGTAAALAALGLGTGGIGLIPVLMGGIFGSIGAFQTKSIGKGISDWWKKL